MNSLRHPKGDCDCAAAKLCPDHRCQECREVSHQQTICPKCGFARSDDDRLVMPGTCPACGIAYNKWRQSQGEGGGELEATAELGPGLVADPDFCCEAEIGNLEWLKQRLLMVPEKVDSIGFYGRLLMLLLFFCWGCSFVFGGIDWPAIGGSFMHNINLPFHEFGHVLFMPLGRFMMILGGSLFQVLMPLGLMLAFIFKQRDPFAGSMMLWWSGQSLIDLSPYIADAPYRAIPLIRGLGEDAHDWGNLLSMTGSLDRAQDYARLSFVWGIFLLYLQKIQLAKRA